NIDILFCWLTPDAAKSKENLAELHRGLLARSEGTSWRSVFCLCVLADVCRAGGYIDEGLAVLASIPPAGRGSFYTAEIQRIEGDLRSLLPSSDPNVIEECYESALVAAQACGALSLKLRAATSLARLWRNQNHQAKARELLVPIYGRFTEGFLLPDLRAAKALIDDLGHAIPFAGDAS